MLSLKQLQRRVRQIFPQREAGRTVASSPLFLALSLHPPGDVHVTYYYGLKTNVVLSGGVLYVADEVELPEHKGRKLIPADRQIAAWLNAAEAKMAKLGIDPVEDAEKTVDLLTEVMPRQFSALAPALYRFVYDYGVLAPIFLAAERFGITDVLLTEASPVVEVESYKYGVLKTNVELSEQDRKTLAERVSLRVGALSAYNPFVSKYDRGHDVRVTAIGGDIAPKPSFAFRVMKYKWLAPTFVAAGGAEPWQMAYLCVMWRRRHVILAAGLPGSGKTSLINAVMSCTQPERRLAIIQSVPELWVPQAAFTATERVSLGAGIPDILMSQLVQRFGLRANSEVAINELLTETDVRAFVTVVYAGFGAAATIHAANAAELLLRLARLGVSEAELAALKPKLIVPVMRRRPTRAVEAIWEPRWKCPKCGAYVRPMYDKCRCGTEGEDAEIEFVKVTREEALADPEVAKWERIIADAARNPATHSPDGWMAVLSSIN